MKIKLFGKNLIESKVSFFVLAAIVWGVLLLIIDIYTGEYLKPEFFENILFNAHGMMFDLVVLGILQTVYESATNKRNDIQRLRDELSDFRGWFDENEPIYRIAGIIRRLNNHGVTNIDLTNCYLRMG